MYLKTQSGDYINANQIERFKIERGVLYVWTTYGNMMPVFEPHDARAYDTQIVLEKYIMPIITDSNSQGVYEVAYDYYPDIEPASFKPDVDSLQN